MTVMTSSTRQRPTHLSTWRAQWCPNRRHKLFSWLQTRSDRFGRRSAHSPFIRVVVIVHIHTVHVRGIVAVAMTVIQHVEFDHFFSVSVVVVAVVCVGVSIPIISITVGGGSSPVMAIMIATHFVAVDVDRRCCCCSECSGGLINSSSEAIRQASSRGWQSCVNSIIRT